MTTMYKQDDVGPLPLVPGVLDASRGPADGRTSRRWLLKAAGVGAGLWAVGGRFGPVGGDAARAAATASVAASPPTDPPLMRVLVEQRAGSFRLSATRPPVLDGQSLAGPVRLNLPEAPVPVSLTSGGWRVGNQGFARGELSLVPAEDGSVGINGNRFRGRFRLVPVGPETFDVVNDLDTESYLMGVLPRELPASWNAETYRAQAVVARTYGLWELRTAGRTRGHYDVFTDDRSQVYGGMNAETQKSRDAVTQTHGQVAVHTTPVGLRIFKAYFHSTSGGVTISNADAFKEAPVEPLGSQPLGDAGAGSPRFRWDPLVIEKGEFARRLKLWGGRRNHSVGRIAHVEALEVAATNPYGRPTRFEIVDARGTRYTMTPEEVRWAFNTDTRGAPSVFSGFFTPINNRQNVVFSDGRGWGHGVGMCQWTAEGWARNGRHYVRIVTDSYPGTRVVRAY